MIFSRAGFNALKFAYLVLLAGIGVTIFLGMGSYLYWETERKNAQQSERSLQDLRSRLDTAERDLNDLRGSEVTYKSLAARGVFIAEERFDLIETLAALKSRHQLVSFSYEVAPQRPLRLGSGAAYTGVNVVGSRIKLQIHALHDGHLISFLDEFPRLQRGFFPLDRCAIKRSEPPGGSSTTSTVPALTPLPTTATTRPVLVANPTATLEAECSLEWITLQSKGGSVVTPAVSPAVPNPKP